MTDSMLGNRATISTAGRQGTVESVDQRDGHCIVTVRDTDGEAVELTVTLAIRDLFLSRLAIDDSESPVGERVWYRKHGG